MKNARTILSPAELATLQARITQLETRTDSEVVCAVATESGRYDRAESLCGLTVALAALISLEKIIGLGTWERSSSLSLGAQALTVVLGFVAGTLLASYWHGLRRLFTGRREIDAEVQRSVNQVFAQRGIGETRRRGGVLIYLSLFERRVEIRCDRTLADRLPPMVLPAIRDAVLARLKTGDLSAGLLGGLDVAETALAEAMPAIGAPAEPLPNAVVLFHPRPK
jgi:putative membrane protein